jgi:hypothetical protein
MSFGAQIQHFGRDFEAKEQPYEERWLKSFLFGFLIPIYHTLMIRSHYWFYMPMKGQAMTRIDDDLPST